MNEVETAVLQSFRSEYGRTVAVLVRMLGDLGAAEDAVQEAFTAAVQTWPERGVPPNPQAWVITVARRRAIDRLRREDTARDHLRRATPATPEPAAESLEDDELRLLFLCCHASLSRESQVILTLRFAGGLTVPEIARAFGLAEPTVAQRLSRAKAKVRDAAIAIHLPEPERWDDRLTAVLTVVYLVYNEGYAATTGGLVRDDLCQEARRLAENLLRMVPGDPETRGLLALLLLLEARRPARTGSDGSLVPLPRQDRSRWRDDLVRRGQQLTRDCLTVNQPGPYQIQAAIQAVHCDAATDADTDWRQILALYDHLMMYLPTAAVATSRCVAVARVNGAAAALADLDRISDPNHYTLAVRADLLARLERHAESRELYAKAASLTRNTAERQHLLARSCCSS